MFGAWLEREIERAGMNKSGFAAVIGPSHTTVLKWISNERIPRDMYIPRIARALGVPEVDVHRALGRIPKSDDDYPEEVRRLAERIESLPPEDRAILESLASQFAERIRGRDKP